MQDFYAKKPNFQTAGKQLAMVRAQDVARVFVPNGQQILLKGLDRITVNKEPAETVMKDIAGQPPEGVRRGGEAGEGRRGLNERVDRELSSQEQ